MSDQQKLETSSEQVVDIVADPKSLDDVDTNMASYADRQQRIDAAKSAHNATVSRMQTELKDIIEPLEKDQALIEEVNGRYIKKNRAKLIRYYDRKVIRLENGVIAIRIIGKSLVTPRVTTMIVNFLLRRRGGMEYLTVKYSLNRDALKEAGPSLLRSLRPFGVAARQHEDITMKPYGIEDPIILDHRPYGVRSKAADLQRKRTKK